MSTTNITNSLLNLKENKISQVRASLGSLFTKDDVVSIIENLFTDIDDVLIEQTSETETNTINFDVVNNAINTAIRDYDFESEITIDNPRFSIDYSNCIELDSYDVDIHKGELITHISDYVKTIFTENNANA